MKSYISAIKAILKSNNITISEDQYLLSSMIKACHLKNDKLRTRLPIQKAMLGVLLREVQKHFETKNQPDLSAMYRAIFSTMYFGLFHISEIALGAHNVLARDIHIGENKKFLSDGCNCLPCPYQLLNCYLHYRGGYITDNEWFFIFSDRTTVTAKQVTGCLRLMLHKAGFNEKNYSSHSLLSGRTCDLFKLGLSVETIKNSPVMG